MNTSRWLAIVVMVSILFFPMLVTAQEATPTGPPAQPTQPATGPGGAEYAYTEVRAQHYGPEPDGKVDSTGYWIFEPAAPLASTTTNAVPLILFFHGYFGTDPVHYRAWIDHLVGRGAVVVYPDYQPLQAELMVVCPNVCSESERPTLPLAITAIREALVELDTGSHMPVDLTKVGATGHSWGGMMSAKYAAVAEAEGLPVPAVIMPADPACLCDFAEGLETIPTTTRVIILIGKDDVFGEDFSRALWDSMSSIPLDHRDYVRLLSDYHGTPALLADHPLPSTDPTWGGPLDAYDWYGTWKFFDLLTDCAFTGTGCDAALGNTSAQRFMGTWSDGVPVIEPEITKVPASLKP